MENKYKLLVADELVSAPMSSVLDWLLAAGCWLQHQHCCRALSLRSHLPPGHPPARPPARPPVPQDGYRNQGGFHMIGSGRDAIAKPEQLAAAEKVRRGPACNCVRV